MTTAALRGSAAPLARSYDVALLDLDGVAYVGADAVPHAAESLAAARAIGMRLAFVTNNASRTPETVAKHLTALGIAAEPDEVVTSSLAAARLLADLVPPGAPVLVVGGEGLRRAVTDAGFRVVADAADEPAAVAQGLAFTTTWAELAEATIAVGRGVPWVAANLDLTLPTPRGTVPGNGAIVGVVAEVTGRTPLVAGKPEPPLHEEAVRRSRAARPLVVGDRLDTDIEGAVRAGTDSLLLLTGVTDAAALLRARAQERPSYLARDLRGLLTPHPAVVVEERGTRCGGWRAVASDRRLRVERSGGDGDDADGLDGLRALAALAWAYADAEGPAFTVAGEPADLAALGLG